MKGKEIRFIFVFSIILFVILFTSKVSAISVLTYNINISDPLAHSVLESNQVNLPSVLLVVNTDVDSSCKYSSTKGLDYSSMGSSFELEYGTLHKITINGLIDGQYKAYVKCKNQSNFISQELEIVYTVSLPITAQISLENGANLKDGKTSLTLITSKVPKTTPTLSYTTDSITYKQIPLVGNEKIWSGYLIIPTDRENEVGSFKFQARDLEDNIGTEITSGAIFTIDTIPPNSLLDIKAEGISKGINLTWKTDEEKLSFNIYRATTPGVSYSDFYKKVNKENYVDTDVSAKTPYYYKISGVDSAGNEGSLSNEVYAISTLSTSSANSNSLDLRYVSLVESLLDKIDSTVSALNSLSATFESQSSEEKEMFEYLKIENSIASAKSAAATLRNEVNSYISQPLSKSDLDKKLNSAEVRLNIIKSSTPQRLRVSNKVVLSNNLNQNEISTHILEIKPNLEYNQLNTLSEESLGYIENNQLKVSGQAYNIEVTYLDESQKTFTLMSKEISLNVENKGGISLIEVIPKDIAQSSKDLEVYNKDYTVLKDDPILSFEASTNKIVYYVKENIDLNSISKTYTFAMNDQTETYSSSKINGYFTLNQLSDVIPSSNITVGVILIVGLGMYLIFVRIKKREIKLNKIEDNIEELNNALYENDFEKAMQKYSDISKAYKELSDKDKKKMYSELADLHKKIIHAKAKNSKSSSLKQYGLFIGIFTAMILLLTSFTVAFDNLNLLEGKNNVTLNNSIDVKTLVKLNPEIESITYQDEISGQSYAYINVFGGIGKKFTLESGKEYEIISKKNTTLITYNK
ncbi:MAG TPA: hypothetical protein VHA12_03625 [Candidatus Nanoarchaeia archaeon]|nr:hypothetical protein [Candidatus Nanoarchaeia archaeon]